MARGRSIPQSVQNGQSGAIPTQYLQNDELLAESQRAIKTLGGCAMRWCVAILAFALLGGCATKYQQMGLTGGVAAEPLMTDIYRIVARGNGYTSADRVQDFVLLKAAETTLAAGGSHFLILEQSDRTKVDIGQTPGVVQTNVYGNSAFTTYTPGSTYNIVKPGEAVMIRVLRVVPGQTPPPGGFSAQDISNNIGPRLRSQS
jgi:hypothetical protein